MAEKTGGRAEFLETLKAAIISMHERVNFSKKNFSDIFWNVHFLRDAISGRQS